MTPIMVVDAFTDRCFAGNPAAVCLLKSWPQDRWLGDVAREMNLSETAFLVHRGENEYDLRWFTPTIEVALCGHATLGSAHALWSTGRSQFSTLTFHTKSGPLTATRAADGGIQLDFPAKPATPCPAPPGLLESLDIKTATTWRNEFDYLVELASEEAVRSLKPDFPRLAKIECRGIIATARSDNPKFDFVSRFFAPRSGVDEDPVTGSAHCCLADYWGEKLGRTTMCGFQASARGGSVQVTRQGNRILLGGQAVTIWEGQLQVPPK